MGIMKQLLHVNVRMEKNEVLNTAEEPNSTYLPPVAMTVAMHTHTSKSLMPRRDQSPYNIICIPTMRMDRPSCRSGLRRRRNTVRHSGKSIESMFKMAKTCFWVLHTVYLLQTNALSPPSIPPTQSTKNHMLVSPALSFRASNSCSKTSTCFNPRHHQSQCHPFNRNILCRSQDRTHRKYLESLLRSYPKLKDEDQSVIDEINEIHPTHSEKSTASSNISGKEKRSTQTDLPNPHPQTSEKNNHDFSTTKSFNQDIARTLFPPLFFSLNYSTRLQNQHNQQLQISLDRQQRLHHINQRPSPFQHPTSAQNAERMLRRMMENRYRSDGRTVCPDAQTFHLVAGAYGRLRWGGGGKKRNKEQVKEWVDDEEEEEESFSKWRKTLVTWEEEPKIDPRSQLSTVVDDSVKHSDIDCDKSTNTIGKILIDPTDKLQELLQLQLQLFNWEDRPEQIRPHVGMYNRVLKRLAGRSLNKRGSKLRIDAEQAWLWLQLMESPLGEHAICPADASSYAHVIEALSSHQAYKHPPTNNSHSKDSILKPIELLVQEISSQPNLEQIPENPCPKWFLSKADDLLSILEEEYDSVGNLSVSKSGWSHREIVQALVSSYPSLLKAWGRYAVFLSGLDPNEGMVGNDPGKHAEYMEYASSRSRSLLHRLEELHRQNNKLVPSDCYSSVILALSVSNRVSSAHYAEEVLNDMMSMYGIKLSTQSDDDFRSLFSSSLFDVNDIAIAHSGCIATYAKSNNAPGAENILMNMISLYKDGRLGDGFVPEPRAFITCISSWAKYVPSNDNGEDDSSGHWSDDKIENSRRNGSRKHETRPSQRQHVYNTNRAKAILSQLENVLESEASKDNDQFQPGAIGYNIVIQMLAKTTIDNHSNRESSTKNFATHGNRERYHIIAPLLEAMTLLDHMEYDMRISADAYTYSILLNAWVQLSGPGNEEAADRADELLRRKLQGWDVNDDPVAAAKANVSENDLWPNQKHYSSVLKAHAKTKSAGGARKALALLSEMEKRYWDATKDRDDAKVSLRNETYAPKPDKICYSIVIDAFANSRLPEASSVSQRLLDALERKYEAGDHSMKPNTRIYTAVILALVNSPFFRGGVDDDGTDPDRSPNNAEIAWSIIERMKKYGVSPNSFTYNYVINCASFAPYNHAEDQRISFEIALRAFRELRKSRADREKNEKTHATEKGREDVCHPDSFTYAFMLKACSNLLPSGSFRTRVMTETFRECCRSGYLNDAVLSRLQGGVSTEEYLKILEMYPGTVVKMHDLPISWSRRIPKKTARNGRGGMKKIIR